MDPLRLHPHFRLLHVDLRHAFRYISPETDILSGLRFLRVVQHPGSCERPPDYGHRVSSIARDRYVLYISLCVACYNVLNVLLVFLMLRFD